LPIAPLTFSQSTIITWSLTVPSPFDTCPRPQMVNVDVDLFLKFDHRQHGQELQHGVQTLTIPERSWSGRLPQIFIYPQPISSHPLFN
jgi:hypothetical protein